MAEVHRTMFARARPAEAQALGVDDCDGSFLELLEQARVLRTLVPGRMPFAPCVHDDETLGDAQLSSWVPRWNVGYYNSRIPIGPTCMTVDLLDLSPVVSQPENSNSCDTDSSSTREWCLKTHGVLMDTVTSVLSLPAPEALDIGEHIVPLLASMWFDLEEAVEGGPPLAYAPHMVTTAVLRC
ncbi:unnamed protein product [Clonostachys rosea f. rosea IK726]|uniref:Uncharacterized protein n=1 Tax=Clonostachys rosea f. rosea IK726 TaxID=1349383 RepID=A0ACA9UBY0_BIOOC|nr:unnamed protein product [Clonostachys rosea f. rosea IK726]